MAEIFDNKCVREKDLWDKMQAVGALLLPIVLVVVGYFFSSALKDKEIQAEYIKQSIDILTKNKSEPFPLGLRLYAFNILKEFSPVDMPPNLEADLLDAKLEKDNPAYTLGGGFGDGGALRLYAKDNSVLYVYIDGILKAITPVTIGVPPGIHKVQFKTKTGKELCSTELTIDYGKVTQISCDRDTGVVAPALSKLVPNKANSADAKSRAAD